MSPTALGQAGDIGALFADDFVGASLLAKNVQTTRAFRQPVSSLTSIAGKPAPTGDAGLLKNHDAQEAGCASGNFQLPSRIGCSGR